MKCFLFSLFSWKFEGADIVMEWVAVIGSVCAVFMLIIEMLESSYRKKELQRDHQDIKEKIGNEKEKLSTEHANLSKEHASLSQEHSGIQEASRQILSKVTEIDKFISVEAERRSASQALLSEGQREIRHHVEAITSLYRELERVQIENAALKVENQRLNQELHERKLKQEQALEYEEQEMSLQ
ncbi:MAG: hypothetical protein ACLSD3_12915 [Acutalibacteraceae bacterium]